MKTSRHGGISRRRPIGRTFLAALGAFLLAVPVLPATPAAAHNVLKSSSPAAGSVRPAAPETVELVFDQEVDTEYAQLALIIGQQAPLNLTPENLGQTVTARIDTAVVGDATGAAAVWQIGYRVVSADGHPISGSLSFTVGTGPAAQALAEQAARTTAPPGNGNGTALTVLGGLGAGVVLTVVVALYVIRRRERKSTPAAGTRP